MSDQSYPAHGEPCEGPPPWCRPTFVIISVIEGQNAPKGVTEHSFFMARDPDRINIWTSHSGWKIDGKANAEAYAKRDAGPNEALTVWNVEDPELPIAINWTQWWADNAPTDKTLSGVRDKFKARNAPFSIKEA